MSQASYFGANLGLLAVVCACLFYLEKDLGVLLYRVDFWHAIIHPGDGSVPRLHLRVVVQHRCRSHTPLGSLYPVPGLVSAVSPHSTRRISALHSRMSEALTPWANCPCARMRIWGSKGFSFGFQESFLGRGAGTSGIASQKWCCEQRLASYL